MSLVSQFAVLCVGLIQFGIGVVFECEAEVTTCKVVKAHNERKKLSKLILRRLQRSHILLKLKTNAQYNTAIMRQTSLNN